MGASGDICGKSEGRLSGIVSYKRSFVVVLSEIIGIVGVEWDIGRQLVPEYKNLWDSLTSTSDPPKQL